MAVYLTSERPGWVPVRVWVWRTLLTEIILRACGECPVSSFCLPSGSRVVIAASWIVSCAWWTVVNAAIDIRGRMLRFNSHLNRAVKEAHVVSLLAHSCLTFAE